MRIILRMRDSTPTLLGVKTIMADRMESRVESGRRSSRTRRRKKLFHLLVQKARRRLKIRRRRSARDPAPSLLEVQAGEQKRIESFEKWCKKVGLELHPKIMIGRRGSCAEIGVVAVDDISRGECLAVIPRRLLLSCANSDIADLVLKEKQLMEPTTSSWLPLLIAIAAECTKKESSYWWHYLSLVPNNDNCNPPIMWVESERARLLEGTGLLRRVDNDLERIEEDFTTLVLPFMLKYHHYFSPSVQCLSNYLKLVSMVMSYSFTDAEETNFLSQTMMVPFVDLLNHHSQHHVELKFAKSSLKLMVIRDIKKGEEVMNTYGELSNASLLHTYGFTEEDNPHDEALISVAALKAVYFSSSFPGVVSVRRERWKVMEENDLLEPEYSVYCSGRASQELLEVIRLLLAKEGLYTSLTQKHHHIKFSELKSKEKSFLHSLAEHCLSAFPESQEQILSIAGLQTTMTTKGKYAYTLARGQQNCLKALCTRIQAETREY